MRDEIIQEDNGESQPRRLVISWNNCRDGRILLLPQNYVFPSMTLSNLLTMWYCGNRSKNIPPYRMVRGYDMREMKRGIQKLSTMKKLAKNVERGVRILNLPHLLVQKWTSRHFLDLYNAVKHLFGSPSLNKKRRFETIACKTYYNIFCARKSYLVGEKLPKNLLKENVSYQNHFFSCITIFV